jgi:hypothetical protein
MPRAVVNTDDTVKKELKTCPDGFVILRRLSFGEKLSRRAMVSSMRVETGRGKDFSGEMQLVNEKATAFDFQKCIVEHNLEDAHGNMLDFRNSVHIQMLDPRIGEEIDTYISELNNFDEEDEGGMGNLSTE